MFARTCDAEASELLVELAGIPNLEELLLKIHETLPMRLYRQGIERFEQKRLGQQGDALLELLLEFKEAEYADIRDKAFGLFTSAPSRCQKGVPITYGAPVSGRCQSCRSASGLTRGIGLRRFSTKF